MPGTGYAIAVEATVATNPVWSGSFDLLDNLLPLSFVKRRTRLDRDYLLAVGESQFDLAGRARKRKIERVWVASSAGILTWFSNTFEENEPQFCGIKVGPTAL